MNDSTGEKLITPKELASIFGVSVATIYRLIEGRKIIFYKVGGGLRFKKVDIDEYLNGTRVEPIKL